MPGVTVRTMTAEDADWADRLLSGYQATRMTARLGELLDPLELPGLVAEVGGSPVGLLTYQVEGDQMEALTMHAQASGHGAGSALLAAAVVEARHAKARRLWLVTTNDNLSAIRFYLRRGMHVARVHEGAVDRDRQLKPEMARVNGENGIPMRDLVEFELDPAAWEPGTAEFPEMRDLNLLPPESAQALLSPLFEGAPRFLVRLVAARPFEGDHDFVEGARRVARELPDEEAIELLTIARGSPPIGTGRCARRGLSRSPSRSRREARDPLRQGRRQGLPHTRRAAPGRDPDTRIGVQRARQRADGRRDRGDRAGGG